MFLVTLGNNFISSKSTGNNYDISNILLGEHLLSAMQFILISVSKPQKENTLFFKWCYLNLKYLKKTENTWALIFSNFYPESQ